MMSTQTTTTFCGNDNGVGLEEALYGFLSPPRYDQTIEWSLEENKIFEEAMGEFEISNPNFIENVAARVPWRTLEDVKEHFQALVYDLELINSGRIPLPRYKDDVVSGEEEEEEKDADADNGGAKEDINQVANNEQIDHLPQAGCDSVAVATAAAAAAAAEQTNNGQPQLQQRRRAVPWTEEEHQLFLMGLNKYGKGDWRSISRFYVISKTPTQVASHAQKYFRRQTCCTTPVERRRPSIHDINTVNPIPKPMPIPMPDNNISINQRMNMMRSPEALLAGNNLQVVDVPPAIPIPISNPNFHGLLNPTCRFHDLNCRRPMFVPIGVDRAFMNQQNNNNNNNNTAANSSYLFPSFASYQQQPWG
ncbi:transcription factor SRM1-like [Andrographis paniculata]|uniref:transcription factor SRM1-like n=1 Tax=Andrographis paniculata TaxID=175694 RepID=UPI0021E97329|nr:transcription factor SRM1-like [Andrographis paniculata]